MRHAALALIALITLASPALAQGAGTFTRTSNGWRWARDGVTFDLLHRDARWTAAEADAVRQSLDKLPAVLLKKVASVDVRRFYRDVRPIGRDGRPRPTASATTVIEQGFISYGDSLFGDKPTVNRVYPTVIHELGHATQYAVIGHGPLLSRIQAVTLGTPGWTSISWTSAITYGLRSWNGFVSDYARTNDREDFAESVEFYWLAPAELLRVNPRKYAYMRDVVFEGRYPPASSRKPDHTAIDPVRPEIERLGDRKAKALALVKVHGQRFMGPLDGGFNTVRYRGTRALHVPVSRSTIWSWVPAIKTGQAPVTVTTQDGTSPSVAFEVSKPWWKFW
ncbi:MAG: hypothetical protein M9894_34850 [Planctomycetes bacterium]|nr:hypothetical protein [Planctomycetota bacterium]